MVYSYNTNIRQKAAITMAIKIHLVQGYDFASYLHLNYTVTIVMVQQRKEISQIRLPELSTELVD